MRKQLTGITLILIQLTLVVAPFFAQQASANSFATGTLFGEVWLDMNENGIHELSEPARANVVVELATADGEVVATTTTDADGNYVFTELEYGEYAVWAKNTNNVLVKAGMVEIAEVNGTTSLDIAQTFEAIDDGTIVIEQPTSATIFLPFINN